MDQMNSSESELVRINAFTKGIIGCAYTVHNTLGPGFLEKVYENALAHELRKSRLSALQQHRLAVHYDGVVVGEYVTVLFVENTVIVELKAVRELDAAHAAQALNCVVATNSPIALLINFGSRVKVRRLLHPRLLRSVLDGEVGLRGSEPPSVSSGSLSVSSVSTSADCEEV
jgi:GxxExxY protein